MEEDETGRWQQSSVCRAPIAKYWVRALGTNRATINISLNHRAAAGTCAGTAHPRPRGTVSTLAPIAQRGTLLPIAARTRSFLTASNLYAPRLHGFDWRASPGAAKLKDFHSMSTPIAMFPTDDTVNALREALRVSPDNVPLRQASGRTAGKARSVRRGGSGVPRGLGRSAAAGRSHARRWPACITSRRKIRRRW